MAGSHVYSFLSIPVSPRSASLGGSAIAINDGDISLANENPALFSEETDGKFTIEYINYISDINFGYTSYSKHLKEIGTIGIGLQYFSGGEFIETDVNGYKYGNIGMSEFALNLSYAKAFGDNFSIGATIKPIYSHMAQYTSFGLVMDMGASYTSKDRLFTVSTVFKNMGMQITSYIDEKSSVPFDIQAGASIKLAHAPFRFSIVAHNIETPKLTYLQTNYVEPTNVDKNTEQQEDIKIMNEVMKHMIFGVEFVPSKNFFIRLGYNYQRQDELMLSSKPGITGFSWGFGLKISKLHISYANVRYHLASASNHFTITTNLNDFFKH
jgi:hypothetical protein